MPSYENDTAEKVKTRVMVLSDTNGGTRADAGGFWDGNFHMFDAPPRDIDLLIHCGNFGNGEPEDMKATLQAISQLPGRMKLIIPGSDDVPIESSFGRPIDPFNTFAEALKLEDKQKSRGGDIVANDKPDGPDDLVFLDEGMHTVKLRNGAILSVYASPYSLGEDRLKPFTYSSDVDRFNLGKDIPWGKWHSGEAMAIPTSPLVDILVTRGPPFGLFDPVRQRGVDKGCKSLEIAVSRARPLLHCFGDKHDAVGTWQIFWSEDHRARGFESCSKMLKLGNKYPAETSQYLNVPLKGKGISTVLVNGTIRRPGSRNSQRTHRPWISDFFFEKDLSRHG
ncbi:hypothetical protein GLAREA_07346 [Glarea lozoyensis ATCC 20868]|uniref:Metallo-dependent phosphatase n=1 Tax=Glarea lozoyensis (strain ATCC 20868 / MF5171) TaxID=1116229 RepID=S3E127_GLAL2|nr:uncharacterized protein GLAREA_07346 [Glarea lozoyensis ATCC 20868]EPE32213.1 hypothetical protein GLAREA_07346 [Glarea lozoyensis ATCC 20868]